MSFIQKSLSALTGYFGKVKANFKWKHYINYIVIAALTTVFAVLQYTGVLKRSPASLLTQMAYSIVLAVSLNIVVGFLGELSLGHAGFMCVGAYIGGYAYKLIHPFLPPFFALLAALVIGGVAAALVGFLVGLPALRLKGDYLAIVTLAAGEIIRNIFQNSQFFGAADGLTAIGTYGRDLFVPALGLVLVTLIVCQNIIRSRHGRAITAIRDNEIAARSMGIPVTYYKLFAFILGAFFAGLAGVVYAANIGAVRSSAFSFNYSIEILVMVVLGGIGSINGSIIAAVFITYLNNQLNVLLPGELAALKFLVYAVVLILVVIFTNAPGLAKYREKFGINALRRKVMSWLRKNPSDPSEVQDDEAAWDRITTKISMDELLSVDMKPSPFTPDKPDKKGD